MSEQKTKADIAQLLLKTADENGEDYGRGNNEQQNGPVQQTGVGETEFIKTKLQLQPPECPAFFRQPAPGTRVRT